MLQPFIIFCITTFIFTFSCKSYAEQKLTFNLPTETAQSQYVIELMKLAYKSIDYEMSLKPYSYENALKAANLGFFDGQLGRIANISQQYPNLIRVPFALFNFKLLLVHNKTKCLPCNISEFSSISYRAGYPVANKYLNTANFLGTRIPVQNIKTQLSLLTQKKVDAVLLLDFQLSHDLPHFEKIKYKVQEVELLNSYHFLHEKHKKLVIPLTQALNQLKKQGIVDTLKNKHGIAHY
ncbi:hypothetical protein [Pseudoalteromonas denitrificans]|uniref:Solute-binding protein family 3/N-terminal domain-containing protein n=1 Tax=Pseudoalteromonas denitrificans DSM 6059 TaxID=1123010 RepID=A0A1I1E7G3_9GAMM|nr:hypothetical protein [Pseudoalteromonas denitrificans]SFB83079.1 hypothetical protein SAMN02745724_00261 [Pseudoalteromonas denitrificans DSM 6059]